jgi:hypothetical protein
MRVEIPASIYTIYAIFALMFAIYWIAGIKTRCMMAAASKHLRYEYLGADAYAVYQRGGRAALRHVLREVGRSGAIWAALIWVYWYLSRGGTDPVLWPCLLGAVFGVWAPKVIDAAGACVYLWHASRSRGLRGSVEYARWYSFSAECGSFWGYCVVWLSVYLLVSLPMFLGAGAMCGVMAALLTWSAYKARGMSAWSSRGGAGDGQTPGDDFSEDPPGVA